MRLRIRGPRREPFRDIAVRWPPDVERALVQLQARAIAEILSGAPHDRFTELLAVLGRLRSRTPREAGVESLGKLLGSSHDTLILRGERLEGPWQVVALDVPPECSHPVVAVAGLNDESGLAVVLGFEDVLPDDEISLGLLVEGLLDPLRATNQ